MSRVNYLGASIPQATTPSKYPTSDNSDDRLAALERRMEEMNEQLIKQNRDNLDAEYNIDEDNLSESLLKKIRDLESRLSAIEDIINNNP